MTESVSPPHMLSLLAEYDDLNRCNNVLNDGLTEEYFLRFLELQDQWMQQRSAAEAEATRLQKELQDALKAISVWEAKFTHARKLLDAEKKQRIRAEQERDSIEKQMFMARDLLFNDNRGKLNNETLEKLAFLNTTNTTRHIPHGLDQGHARLNTITEMNSTGNLLSDQSFSRSEDDLDESVVNGRRSWRRHRPSASMAPPPAPEAEYPPTKKRRSSGANKVETSNVGGIGGRVVATTTLTVDHCANNCSNGRITASSVIKGFQGSSGTSDEEMSNVEQISATPKMVKSEYNIKIESNSKGHYNTNIKNYTPSAPPHDDQDGWAKLNSFGGSAICSPRGTARLRQHTFVNKTILKPEPCTTCGTRIRFAKAVVKCSDCRAVCHVECKEKLPLPCVPNHTTPNINNMGRIADYTPNVSPMVPALIIHCVNEVESRGLTEVGLYRVPGSEKDVKTLKQLFMRGKGIPPLTSYDINAICGCIKDFLRSLREPLVTNTLWSDFITATELEDRNDSEAALYQAISELPQPNRDTLAFMMLHLQRVAECVDCKMPIENLAKVFGPTIIGYSYNDPPAHEMYKQTLQQFAVMERLLEISSDYWARFAAVTYSDGSSVVASPSLNRVPSQRPRLATAPQLTLRTPVSSRTPSCTSSKRSVAQSTRRGFFYTPVEDVNAGPRRQRKFYGSSNGFNK